MGSAADEPWNAPAPATLVVVPLYNDWECLAKLADRLDAVLADAGEPFDLLVVDDGSTAEPDRREFDRPRRALRRVDVLALRRNLGHQRAIAVGLAYAEDRLGHDVVVVMDSDGEDAPEDVPRLLDALRRRGGREIVFAERQKRSESTLFRVFYRLYKAMHYVLTGKGVSVGNFSAIPRRRLSSLVVVSELWNHYAAAAYRSRQPCSTVPTRRAKRIQGTPKMNFVGLVVHGLSAISVNSEQVGVRLLVATVGLALLAACGLVAILGVRFLTDLAIPGWATNSFGLLLVVLLQAVMLASVFSFVILGSRQGASFLPRRDYIHFVGEVWPLAGGPAGAEDHVPESIHERG